MSALEIERKWLIRRPDETMLAAQPGASVSHICQTYLHDLPGLSRRVRARTADGITVYTQTIKRRIDHMTAHENECVISHAEYLTLLKEADPACRTIEKTRWCIPFSTHTLEIDLYPFWHTQAVLEIELPSPDTPVSLPDWLTVLREVTGNRAYSNHHLAASPIPEDSV